MYVTGSFSGTTAAFGSTTLVNTGAASTTDLFVTKLTSLGNSAAFVWALQAGGGGNDKPVAVQLAGTSVVVTGTVAPPASFGPIVLNGPNQTAFTASLTHPTLTATASALRYERLGPYPNPAPTLRTSQSMFNFRPVPG